MVLTKKNRKTLKKIIFSKKRTIINKLNKRRRKLTNPPKRLSKLKRKLRR